MSLRFGRTIDRDLIRSIVTHPSVFKWQAEDGVLVEDYQPATDNPLVWYVLAIDGRTLIGLFVFEPRTSVKYAVHLAIAPSQWPRGVEAFKGVIEWAWATIGMERICGEIPSDNKHALRLAKNAGFEKVGTEHGAFRRGGKLLDIRIVGISKEVACQQH